MTQKVTEPGRIIMIKKNLLKDYLEENTIMAALQSFLHYFNKKVALFEYSLPYHTSHNMGDQCYTNTIGFSKPVHIPFSQDNFLEVHLQQETFEDIWEVSHGKKPESVGDCILRFPFCCINYLLVQR